MSEYKIVLATMEPRLYVLLAGLELKSEDPTERSKEFDIEVEKMIKEVYPDKKFNKKDMEDNLKHLREFYTVPLRKTI